MFVGQWPLYFFFLNLYSFIHVRISLDLCNQSDGVYLSIYSVMQSDGNSWKIDTFRKAINSELMISSSFWKLLLVRICVKQKLFFAQNFSKRFIHKL